MFQIGFIHTIKYWYIFITKAFYRAWQKYKTFQSILFQFFMSSLVGGFLIYKNYGEDSMMQQIAINFHWALVPFFAVFLIISLYYLFKIPAEYAAIVDGSKDLKQKMEFLQSKIIEGNDIFASYDFNIPSKEDFASYNKWKEEVESFLTKSFHKEFVNIFNGSLEHDEVSMLYATKTINSHPNPLSKDYKQENDFLKDPKIIYFRKNLTCLQWIIARFVVYSVPVKP